MQQITAPELAAWLADPARPQPVLLDVRENWEFATCQIAGSLQIPMNTIPARIDLHGPRVDAAGQVDHLAEAVALQVSGHVQAARAVVADADDFSVLIEVIDTRRYRVHRDQHGIVEMAGVELPLLARVRHGVRHGDAV